MHNIEVPHGTYSNDIYTEPSQARLAFGREASASTSRRGQKRPRTTEIRRAHRVASHRSADQRAAALLWFALRGAYRQSPVRWRRITIRLGAGCGAGHRQPHSDNRYSARADGDGLWAGEQERDQFRTDRNPRRDDQRDLLKPISRICVPDRRTQHQDCDQFRWNLQI